MSSDTIKQNKQKERNSNKSEEGLPRNEMIISIGLSSFVPPVFQLARATPYLI